LRTRRAAVLVLVAAIGCSGDLPPASRVDKLRVLAVRAEPPEVNPGQSSTLDALAVPPPFTAEDAGAAHLSYLWLACAEPPTAQLPTPCGVTAGGNGGPDAFGGGGFSAPPGCDAQPDAPFCLIGDTPVVSFAPPADALAGADVAQWIVTLVVADDTLGGATGCVLSAAQSGTGVPVNPAGAASDYDAVDHCIIALKRLTVSRAAAPNHNPALRSFTLASASLPGGTATWPRSSGANQPLAALRCTSSDAMSGRCPTGSFAEVEADGTVEPLYVSWFVTAGSISSSRSSFQAADCTGECLKMDVATMVATDWTPPDATEAAMRAPTGEVDFWAVVRDDRGGVGWLAGSAHQN
jgi:hypothetical protein